MTVSLLGPDRWDTFQKDAVFAALERNLREGRARGHIHAIGADLDRGFRQIMDHKVGAVIANGKYLIVYDVGATFYTPNRVLFEVLVTAINNTPASFRVIPPALEALAKKHDCAFIVSGNSSGRRAVTRAYERAGFKQSAIQLYKEIQ